MRGEGPSPAQLLTAVAKTMAAAAAPMRFINREGNRGGSAWKNGTSPWSLIPTSWLIARVRAGVPLWFKASPGRSIGEAVSP